MLNAFRSALSVCRSAPLVPPTARDEGPANDAGCDGAPQGRRDHNKGSSRPEGVRSSSPGGCRERSRPLSAEALLSVPLPTLRWDRRAAGSLSAQGCRASRGGPLTGQSLRCGPLLRRHPSRVTGHRLRSVAAPPVCPRPRQTSGGSRSSLGGGCSLAGFSSVTSLQAKNLNT